MPLSITVSDRPPQAELVVHLLRSGDKVADLPPGAVEDAEKDPVLLYDGDRRRGIVRLGDDADERENLRIAAARAASLAARVRAPSVALVADGDAEDAASALVEGFVLGGYRFSEYRKDAPPAVSELILSGPGMDRHEPVAQRALIRAEAACTARDLVNRSPHEKTAPLLAVAARELAEEAGLRCEVWDRARIEAERMGGLLAVNRGSVQEPRFVVIEHRPDGTAGDSPIVLVGKAIVFDTGGLSLKPTKGSMDKMKADMAGGAAVMGAMLAAARLGLPHRVVALIPMTDNRPGGDAYVPGDVVTMRRGSRVEVLNTDAEGRMLLADALDYARELDPRLVVDVATLTGAVVIALGDRVAGVMTTDDDGSEERIRPLVEAGRATGEYVHPLPMHRFYEAALESDVADLKNVGGREGGSITAGKFLEHFTRNDDGSSAYPWIHLDIAGTAFIDSPQPYRPKGGTGFGVRLLTEWLQAIGE